MNVDEPSQHTTNIDTDLLQALLGANDRKSETIERLRAMLWKVEWVDEIHLPHCPFCLLNRPRHARGCEWVKEMKPEGE